MSYPTGLSCFRTHRFTAAVALLALGCMGLRTGAQTAPQLVPYTARLIAGGGTTAIAAGQKCPVSTNVSTDAYGDGCLATEVQLGASATGGPRFAITDKGGNVFLSDYVNGLVRRVDATTGIITAVAGGATSSPATGTACGTGLSTSADGDGCTATLVKLGKPAGLAFDANGNLYFADNGYDEIREVAATGGVITTSGIITHVAGNTTYGYSTNNGGGGVPVPAATAYLNFPYGIAFDAAGNLYIADEGNNAISVINLGLTPRTIQGAVVPAGTIQKVMGVGNLATKATTGECPNFVSTSARGGCYYGKWVDGSVAANSANDGVYSVALDTGSDLYFANEFNNDVGIITPGNIVSNYAGIQASAAKKLTSRGTAGSFGIGSVFGVATDPLNNLYITDASSGAIWRVDAAGKVMYAIAGSAAGAAVCGASTDTLGDGCPALNGAKFGSSGTGNYATTTLPGPGIYGIYADALGDVFVGDTENPVIREVASGTQFGRVGINVSTTDVLDIHFVAGDTPNSYTITAGGSIFTLGTATCTTNTPDNTTDCLLPLTARPTATGPFTGTLQVVSGTANGGTSTFQLSGIGIVVPPVPATRTAVSYTTNAPAACTGTTYAPGVQITATANVLSNGNPGGSVTFYANSIVLGTAQLSPTGTATVTGTVTPTGTYTVTAVYSGDGFFTTSTGTATPQFTVATAAFTATANTPQQSSVAAGGSALYSFSIAQNVYTGTLSFSCSGLPAGATCVFSPNTIVANGCSTNNTVALTVLTSQAMPIRAGGFGAGGRWQMLSVLSGLGLAFAVGLRRRRGALRFGNVWMALAMLLAASGIVACGNGTTPTGATPSGNYTITVNVAGTVGTPTSVTFPLTVQ